jgi:hypothetical protein
MNNNNHFLEIPLEFRIACLLNNFKIQDVLQAYINHVSFFCTLYNSKLSGFSEATYITSEYSVGNKDNQQQTDEDKPAINRMVAVKYIRQMVALSLKTQFTETIRLKQSKKMVNKLFSAIESFKYCPEKLYIDEESIIVFTKDFRIICEIHNIYPKAYLEHFMNKVSWAEAHARVDLDADTMDSGLLFFIKLTNGLGNLKRQEIEITDAVLEYIDEAEQLRAKHYLVRNLEQRIAIYREFFLEHYNRIINQYT